MPARIEISCINRSDRYTVHERILSIGGTNFDGRRWKMSQAGAIRGIEEGKYAFYVNVGGNAVNVIVAIGQNGHKYLKTFADRDQPNHLLSLPECPP